MVLLLFLMNDVTFYLVHEIVYGGGLPIKGPIHEIFPCLEY